MGKRKDTQRITEQLIKEKQQRKKLVEADQVFYTKLIIPIMTLDLHLQTIYRLIKVKHIDQMLDTMYETTIKEYKLHEPTVRRLMEDKELKDKVEQLIEEKYKKCKIQV